MTPELRTYCKKWSRDVAGISDDRERMHYFGDALPDLLLDRDALRPVVERMAQGRRWPSPGSSGIFDHEVLLYLDPSRRFSMRLYFHPGKSHTPVHDHTGWGVSGVSFGRLSVVHYAVQGSIGRETAQIEEKTSKIFNPGEVAMTLPWDAGIHKTGTPDENLNMMLSIYGRPGRRLYVNIFDPDSGRVERRYPSKILKRQLARKAMRMFDQ